MISDEQHGDHHPQRDRERGGGGGGGAIRCGGEPSGRVDIRSSRPKQRDHVSAGSEDTWHHLIRPPIIAVPPLVGAESVMGVGMGLGLGRDSWQRVSGLF